VELATTSFGQGVSVTPIQQVAAVSAAINGGRLFKPHIAKAWYNPETGEKVSSVQPEMGRQVISANTSLIVRQTLESVVAQGTGKNAFLDGYRVGGKTGTAQKVVNGRYDPNEHIVSFIGFAPANDPKIVVYAAVDDPQGVQFGGLIAAPLVKNIMAAALPYLGVQPQKDQLARKYQPGDIKTVEVPNLVGMTITDIYEDLNSNFLLAKSGAGNTVVNQVPKAGARVTQGATIRIYLSDTPKAD
jgi:stage V sporulation protein D (sporulation-specific penicillin-binding protein)